MKKRFTININENVLNETKVQAMKEKEHSASQFIERVLKEYLERVKDQE